MKNIDLLLFGDGEGGKTTINDSYIQDMGLENLAGCLEADPEAYGVFMDTLKNPLTDAEKIEERQNILKDFQNHPGLAQRLKSICIEAQQNKCQTHYSEPDRVLAAYNEILSCSMGVAGELLSMLRHREFSSAALKELRAQLDCQKKFDAVKARIDKMIGYIKNGEITLALEYGSGFKFRGAEIYPYEPPPGETPESRTNNPILKLFQNRKAKEGAEPDDGFCYGSHFIMENEIGAMQGGAFTYVSGIIRDINRHILSFCDLMAKQLSFYTVAMELIRFMENGRLKTAFPELCRGQAGIKAKGLCDFGLLLQNRPDFFVSPNDFDDCGGAYYLISGSNRGGKTTFMKSVGIAQLFAQAGLPVAAESYVCPVFGNLFSHFPKDEDEDLNFGKLAEELTRIKKSLPQIADNALVLLNESFATTTETEGFDLASDILRALSETKSKVLFVTHNYLLLKNRREVCGSFANGVKLMSLIVAEGESPSERTYRIVEGEPGETIHTVDFLDC